MARNRGSSSCSIQLVLVLAIMLVGFIAVGFSPQGFEGLLGRIGRGGPAPAAREEQLAPAAVLSALPRNRLESTVMIIDQLVEGKREGNVIQDWLFRDRLLLQVRGEVIAGVDMSKLTQRDIIIQDESVRVTLPPSEIFLSRIDNQRTTVYERDTGILTSGDPELESQLRRYAESRLVPAACSQEILQQAAAQSRESVTRLLKLLGFEQITVDAPVGDCPE